MNRLKSLSILVPAYNVEETLQQVLAKTREIGLKITSDLEMVVVEDGSTDTTAHILEDCQIKWKELRIISHPKNLGYGQSIRDLYLSGQKEWLVTMPSDDQIDPQEILKLTDHVADADLILGKREIRGDHFKRRMQSKTYNFLLKLLFQIPITDVNTIRLMKKSIMQKIKLKYTSPFVDAEQIIKTSQQGFRVIEVPILHKARKTPGATGGKFLTTIWPTIKDMISFCFYKNV